MHIAESPTPTRSRRVRKIAAGAAAILVATLGGSVAVATAPAGAAVTVPITFSVAGAYTYTVPTGVTSVHIHAVGGTGDNRGTAYTTAAGRGADVVADLAVTGNQTLYVNVGGNGNYQVGGANGGGNGGAAGENSGDAGGGASDVRTNQSDLTSRVVVAAGGSGAGYVGSGGDAEKAGTTRIGNGTPAQPGTQDAGGAAGLDPTNGNGSPGSFAQGGDGVVRNLYGTGGGGGGWYGGGSGGGYAGGAGGSNHFGAGTSNTSATIDTTKVPTVTISYQLTDTTAPVITPSVNPTTPDGSDGWYQGSPTVHFTVTDPESAVTKSGCDDATVSTDTTADGTTFTCSASSAGGTATPVSVTIKRDATAPTASFDATGFTNGASYGASTLPNAPTCTAADAGSGSDGCVVTGYSTALGDHILTATAKDEAGNTGTATLSYTIVDSTPPVITPAVTPGSPDGLNGWYKSSPSVSWKVSDPESGVSSKSPACDAVTTVSADTTGDVFTCSAPSAGARDSESVTIKRDAAAPAITFGGTGVADNGSYVWGSTPAAPTCSAMDALSGISINSDGSTCTITGDYSTAVGTHVLTANATDLAGNAGTATLTYTVTRWSASVFQPVDLNGVYNTVKGGSTVPVKFTVKAGAMPITDPATVGTFTASKFTCNTSAPTDGIETTTTGATSLRYDDTAGQFIYNWQTPKTPGSCYRLTLTTADGTKTQALFQLK
jgi:hypothetical protein